MKFTHLAWRRAGWTHQSPRGIRPYLCPGADPTEEGTQASVQPPEDTSREFIMSAEAVPSLAWPHYPRCQQGDIHLLLQEVIKPGHRGSLSLWCCPHVTCQGLHLTFILFSGPQQAGIMNPSQDGGIAHWEIRPHFLRSHTQEVPRRTQVQFQTQTPFSPP